MECVEPKIGDALDQELKALDDVVGRNAERGEHDTDHDRQKHQADDGAGHAVAEELAPIHGLSPGCGGGALRPDSALA